VAVGTHYMYVYPVPPTSSFHMDPTERDRKLGGQVAFAFFLVGAPAALGIGFAADRVRATLLSNLQKVFFRNRTFCCCRCCTASCCCGGLVLVVVHILLYLKYIFESNLYYHFFFRSTTCIVDAFFLK